MSSEPFSNIVYSKNVIEFVTVANEFCAFAESVEQFKRKDFITRLQKLFPLLYLKATLIPEVEQSEEALEKFVTEDDYNFLLDRLKSKFGVHDAYQEVFDPAMQFSEIAVVSSLSENVADIYQDLKDFIFSYRMGTVEVMSDALAECKSNFENYWGQKLVNGLRALHNLVYGDAELEEADDDGEFNLSIDGE